MGHPYFLTIRDVGVPAWDCVEEREFLFEPKEWPRESNRSPGNCHCLIWQLSRLLRIAPALIRERDH